MHTIYTTAKKKESNSFYHKSVVVPGIKIPAKEHHAPCNRKLNVTFQLLLSTSLGLTAAGKIGLFQDSKH